ncbi:hypothetical protein [Robbsia andropogonis]|uniref:hypothetical protein n=1 Tax=Robbsia andropogonis TaxID=28092 RepID=UPI0004AD44D3|nr:hypothetical protein [Robbsia andropogonis]
MLSPVAPDSSNPCALLRLSRINAEPAFDQLNGPPAFNYAGDTTRWQGQPNWSPDALSRLDTHTCHMTLQGGELDDSAIHNLMRFPNLASLELVHVDIPPRVNFAFVRALMLLPVKRIYYTNMILPDAMALDAQKIKTMIYAKAGLMSGAISMLMGSPHLQRLDVRGALLPSHLNTLPLMQREQPLDTFLCQCDVDAPHSDRHNAADALLHLPVRNLTLDGGAFDETAAVALGQNPHLESLTLQHLPLTRAWIEQIITPSVIPPQRLPTLRLLTIVAPREVRASGRANPYLVSRVDRTWLNTMHYRHGLTIEFREASTASLN